MIVDYGDKRRKETASLGSALGENDVHFGTGYLINTLRKRGSGLYQQLIKSNSERYKECPNNAKRSFAVEHVILPIKASGGRFLELSDRNLWEEVESDETIIKKVMQALRDVNKKRVEGVEKSDANTGKAKIDFVVNAGENKSTLVEAGTGLAEDLDVEARDQEPTVALPLEKKAAFEEWHETKAMQAEGDVADVFKKGAEDYDDELTSLWRSMELLDTNAPTTWSNSTSNSSDSCGDYHAANQVVRLALHRVETRIQSLNSQLSVAFEKIEELLSKNFSLRKENARLEESNRELVQQVSLLQSEKERLQIALSTNGVELVKRTHFEAA